jgi:hypothetical protein
MSRRVVDFLKDAVKVSFVVEPYPTTTTDTQVQPSSLPQSPNPLPQTKPPPPKQSWTPKVRDTPSFGDYQLRNIDLVDVTLVREPAPVPKRKGRPPNSKSKPPHTDNHGTYFFITLLAVTLPTILRYHYTTITATAKAEAEARGKSERTSIQQKATTED